MESTKLMVTLASHASVPVGAVKTGDSEQRIVPFAPCPLNTGAVLSTTLIVWLTAALILPQSSIPLQVLLTDCPHEPGMMESTKLMVTLASHTSVAVGAVNTGVAEQL